MGNTIPGLILFTATASGIVIGVMLVWRIWQDTRKARRTRVYDALARRVPFLQTKEPERDTEGLPPGSLRHHCDRRVSGSHRGFDVEIFEHLEHYREPGAPICTQTMLEVSTPGWKLPMFEIYPTTFGNRMLNKILGRETLVFGHDPAFSDNNFVQSRAPEQLFVTLTPEVRAPLRRNRNLYVDCNGALLRFYRPETLMSEQEILKTIPLAMEVAEAIRRNGNPSPAPETAESPALGGASPSVA